VLGVAARSDPGSVDVLTNVGVDRIVMDDAGPLEFLEALVLLMPASSRAGAERNVAPAVEEQLANVVVVRGPVGAGATEVAIGLAHALGRNERVTLLDLDEIAPSVAQRLALSIEPNVRTAIDAVEYGIGEIEADSPIGLRVVPGLPNAASWNQIRPPEIERLVRHLRRDRDHLVVDIAAPLEEVGAPTRGRHAIARLAIAAATHIVAVADGSPVGVTRLVQWLASAHELAVAPTVHVVLNRAPRDAFRCSELVAEIGRCYRAASVRVVVSDRSVTRAMWDGTTVGPGAFCDAMNELAATISPARPPVRSLRWPGRREVPIQVATT
jgi:MinD-like ATPase involved in chromosome partitioning or flagellar assembly